MQEIFWHLLLTQNSPYGQTGATVQLLEAKIVPTGQLHCPLFKTSGGVHVVAQLVPFHAVLGGQTQTELMLSNIIPPVQVMH